MRFQALTISNFKAISHLELSNLTDFVLIAGPNGCGKSCVFDAVRLLKSFYGGYQPNEWQQWFGEFQIDINDRGQLSKLFRDPQRPMLIEASVQLADDELAYLAANAESVLEPLIWQRVTGQSASQRRFGVATQFREFGPRVASELGPRVEQLRAELEQPHDKLRIELQPRTGLNVQANPIMELVFQTFDPQHIGIIDYHSASRNYQREALGGVDLNIRNLESQRANQSLYNWQSKYQNVKTELATTYMRDILARQAGVELGESDLNETLKELFRTFFPDKEYLGVIPDPDGSLRFPIRTVAGEHDINELSSGEKEIVYGYLRLRNSAPRNSTILLDEPELHLNPGLLRGMPTFYHKHVGQARSNQLWLVTHSDTLLRHAVGNTNYSVFHMSPPLDGLTNQVAEVLADDELERATIALVGDLAAYQPRSKVIIFEGGGDSDFDVLTIQRLFPDVVKRVNLVSGGSKRRVRDLHEVLAETASNVGLSNRFFAIVDRDNDQPDEVALGARRFTWDRYHIENYLLSERHILRAANEVATTEIFRDERSVTAALLECATSVAPRVVLDRLRRKVNSQVVSQLSFGGDPRARSASESLGPAVRASFNRLDQVRRELLEEDGLVILASQLEAETTASITDGSWRMDLPGRDILKDLVAKRLRGVASYEAFRLLIIGRMADEGFQPTGMTSVLTAILAAEIDT